MQQQKTQQANMTTAQPQPVVTMTTQQPPVIPSSRTPESTQVVLKIIRGLAISQLVMGSLSILIEIVLIVLASSRYWYGQTIGEGLWCGAWIIVAGALGISASRQVYNRCLITCLLAFSIVGAVFSTMHFGISVRYIFIQWSTTGLALKIIQSLLSFASLVVLIVSACYSGYLIPGCCQPNAYGQPQVVYVTSNPQQPITVQQPGVFGTQGYVIQGHQPVPQMVQYPGIPIQQQMAPVATQHPAHKKEQEALGSQTGQPDHPPVYSNL